MYLENDSRLFGYILDYNCGCIVTRLNKHTLHNVVYLLFRAELEN
jgi:hypothetical protein